MERRPFTHAGEPSAFGGKRSRSKLSSLFGRCLDACFISDAAISLSDGLTVPFALTAGLSALGATRLVFYAGSAELVVGALPMGLGGYLRAKGEADGYHGALEETRVLVARDTHKASSIARLGVETYAFSAKTLKHLTDGLCEEVETFVHFLVYHWMAKEDYAAPRPYLSGLAIAIGYLVGGSVSLLPYLLFDHVREALRCSIMVVADALFLAGQRPC